MRLRRPIAMACLFAVVSCPGVCLAETAEDLARSLAELLHGNVIEAPDASPCDGFVSGGRVQTPVPVLTDRSGPPALWLPQFEGGPGAIGACPPAALAGPSGWPPPTSARRQAWLQGFRC